MLPKGNRLTRSRDFTRTRRFGRSAGSPLAALYTLPNRTDDLRVGFSVSKKVGKATVRNRVKRLMREAVRRELADLRPGHDLVFIARPAAADAPYDRIAETVGYLTRKAGVRRAPTAVARNA